MNRHRLKTWPSVWADVYGGAKKFEVRRSDDRDFDVGDILELDEWDPENGRLSPGLGYSRRVLEVSVTYILRGGRFGLPEHLCVMSLGTPRYCWRDTNDELIAPPLTQGTEARR